MMTLREERTKLVEDEYNSYSPEHFPGSRAWKANQVAYKAILAFDSSHPEVVEEIKKEKAAKDAAEKAYWDSPEGREKMLGM